MASSIIPACIYFSLLLITTFFTLQNSAIESEEEKPEGPFAIGKVPKAPNCNSLPGTPEWEICWDHFRKDMEAFQKNMQEYGRKLQIIQKKSLMFHSPTPTNIVTTNGYIIQTYKMSVTTNVQNGKIQITLPVKTFELLQSKMDKTQIDIRLRSLDGQVKWAKIRVPSHVDAVQDMKIDRNLDSIKISGPAKDTLAMKLVSPMMMMTSASNQKNYAPLSPKKTPKLFWHF